MKRPMVTLVKLLSSAIVTAFYLSLLPVQAHSDDAKPATIQDKDILGYIQEVITWRHSIVDGDLQPDTARAALLKDSLRHNSQVALKSSFDFAHAESAILEETQAKSDDKTKENDRHSNLNKRVADTRNHIADLQDQLKAAVSTAEREKISGEIKVEQAHLDLLESFQTIFSSTENNETGLTGAINKLSYSILGDLDDTAVAKADNAAKTQENKDMAAVQNEDNVLSLASDMVTLERKKKSLDALIDGTAELKKSTQNLMKILRGELQDAIKEGNTLADTPVAADKAGIEKHRHDLDEWFSRYKKLSTAVVPLGQINSLLDASNTDMKEWQGVLGQQWDKIMSHFLIKLGVLCVSLLIPFVFLEIAHRAIVRYVRDSNRLRQLHVVRQVVFVTLLVLVVFLNFFSGFGSLATYAGFITAGLAVALQTVLVSLIAHFFFFGRFGVRAGDRVTISGVTGDVVQVGMLRIYLMELIGDKDSLRPSGKIVAFPNSVLFNATAFSKQVAGTSYTWDDLTFLLDPASDFSLANKKILSAVNTVFSEYKDVIERQHAALEQSTNLVVGVPEPRSEIMVKEGGLTCEVHYPVIIEHAPRVYEKIISTLMKTFEKDKDFRMILSNPIKIAAV